jgi:hypothetical protein
MRRKNKKVSKIAADKPSTSSTESEVPASDKTEQQLDTDNNSNSNKTDLSSSTNDLNSASSNSGSGSDLNEASCGDEVYLCVELKLISVDQRCVDYTKLTEPFLCVSAGALVEHLNRLLVKKMKICEEFFEVYFFGYF